MANSTDAAATSPHRSDSCRASTAPAASPTCSASASVATNTFDGCSYNVRAPLCVRCTNTPAQWQTGCAPCWAADTPMSWHAPSPTTRRESPGHSRRVIRDLTSHQSQCRPDRFCSTWGVRPKSTHLVLRPLICDDVNGAPAWLTPCGVKHLLEMLAFSGLSGAILIAARGPRPHCDAG